ncbi:MAG: DUF4386 domain-containing protein [Gemmatimonadales bacterium]
MTRMTNARIAGFTFLFYIVVGISSLLVFGNAVSGEGVAAKLASISQHATAVRVTVLLNLLAACSAVVLAVALYGITRDEDHELAMLALARRVCEGVLVAISLETTVGLLWLATAAAGAGAPDQATANAIGAFLLMPGAPLAAIFFAVGSTIFSYLLLRGRMVPIPLAWLGVLASALLVVALPLQLAGMLTGAVTSYMVMWMPMLLFEVALALWLLFKGVATPTTR